MVTEFAAMGNLHDFLSQSRSGKHVTTAKDLSVIAAECAAAVMAVSRLKVGGHHDVYVQRSHNNHYTNDSHKECVVLIYQLGQMPWRVTFV